MIGLGSDEKSQSSCFCKLRVVQDGGGEATVVNLLGLSIVLFVVFVLAIVTRQSFRWSLIECHEKIVTFVRYLATHILSKALEHGWRPDATDRGPHWIASPVISNDQRIKRVEMLALENWSNFLASATTTITTVMSVGGCLSRCYHITTNKCVSSIGVNISFETT